MLWVYTDWDIDGLYRILKNKRFDDVEIFIGDFTDGMIEGFKPGSPYSDVTNLLSEWPMESLTEGVRRWFHQ
jgi:hypothetical protein